MKKAIAVIAALALMAGAASCGKEVKDPVISDPPLIDTVPLNFKEAKVTMAEDFIRIISLDKAGANVLIFGEKPDGKFAAYLASPSMNEHTDINFTPQEGEEVQSACIDRFGRVTILTVLNGETLIYTYNSMGISLNEVNLGEVIKESAFAGAIHHSGEGYVINVGSEVLHVIDKDMNYAGEVELKGMMVQGCCTDKEGRCALMLNDIDRMVIARVEGTSLTDITECNMLSSSPYAMSAGNSTYSLIANFPDGLYGLAGSKWNKITDYMENTFNGGTIFSILAGKEGEYVVQDTSKAMNALYLLTERDISEIKERKTVTLLMPKDGNTDMLDKVKRFNSENENYKVEVITQYNGVDRTTEDILEDMRLDIVSGKGPDIVADLIPGLDLSTYYCDLTEFMKDDPDLNEDSFVPGFLDGLRFKGMLPPHHTRVHSLHPHGKDELGRHKGERRLQRVHRHLQFRSGGHHAL